MTASSIEIEWLGHCKQDGSDKLWGICVDHQGDEYTFWCRRGKSIQVKHGDVDYRSMVMSKEDKGYWKVPLPQYDELHPGLLEQLERAIVLNKLRRD